MTRRGFTIVEMVVVLVVLGITAAAVAPALLGSGREAGPHAVADELVAVLSTARRMAVERGEPVTLALGRSGAYVARAGAASDSVGGGSLDLPPGVALAVDGGAARFVFLPLGTARGPAVRVNGAGTSLEVEVDRWTGDARVAGR